MKAQHLGATLLVFGLVLTAVNVASSTTLQRKSSALEAQETALVSRLEDDDAFGSWQRGTPPPGVPIVAQYFDDDENAQDAWCAYGVWRDDIGLTHTYRFKGADITYTVSHRMPDAWIFAPLRKTTTKAK